MQTPDSGMTATISRVDLSLTRKIFALSLPIAVSSFLDSLVAVLDIYMVSHLGSDAVSAVGFSRIITNVIAVVMIAATSGGFTMVAQAIGANSMPDASAAVRQTLTLSFLISVPFCGAGFAAAPWILQAMSLSEPVVGLGIPYLRVILTGVALMSVNYAVTTCLYGAGDMRTPLVIGVVVTTLKIVSSYVLIFGVAGAPKLGVTGAAAGSVCGALVGLVINFSVLYSGRFRLQMLSGSSYWPDPALGRRILRIGIPTALQGLLRNSSGLVFAKLVALTPSSETAVAAYSIGNQMERMLRRTSLSFGTATTTLVGQSLGARDICEAERRGSTAIFVAVSSIMVCSLLLAVGSTYVMRAFTEDPSVIRIGVAYLWAVALAEPLMALSISASSTLRGAGFTRPAMHYTLISQWLVRLPVGYLLAFHAGLGVFGLWAAMVLFCTVQGGLMFQKFRRGDWKKRRI